MGSVGTPIVAVEGGIVEMLGWNRYGGWRIGIRSYDTKRYYYYAHLRSGHPFVEGLKEGVEVKAGDVIVFYAFAVHGVKANPGTDILFPVTDGSPHIVGMPPQRGDQFACGASKYTLRRHPSAFVVLPDIVGDIADEVILVIKGLKVSN